MTKKLINYSLILHKLYFFPFPDCVEIASNAGITAVIQPGGSIKDQLSIDFSENTTNYYGPMSALQIGLIYEKQHNIKQARIYFKRCLSFSHFDYERGIHQKAKLGLARISN